MKKSNAWFGRSLSRSHALGFALAAMVIANLGFALPASGQSISMAAVGPSRLDFGEQAVGKQGSAVVVILANAGSDPLPISEIVPSEDFTARRECPQVLAAGEECRIWVSFKPSGEGQRQGMLKISDDAGTQTVLLRGIGTPVAFHQSKQESHDDPGGGQSTNGRTKSH